MHSGILLKRNIKKKMLLIFFTWQERIKTSTRQAFKLQKRNSRHLLQNSWNLNQINMMKILPKESLIQKEIISMDLILQLG